MKKTFAKWALTTVALSLTFPATAFASDINSRALELAGQDKFSDALAVLSQANSATQASYEHRFLRARILSWAGKYDRAERELNSLMMEFPSNADVQLAAGNLAYYQGDLNKAERYYQMVLVQAPDYVDASRGLENVRNARQGRLSEGRHLWRIDGGLGFSGFDDNTISDWDEQYLRAEYAPDTLAYHGGVQRYNRFDETDVQITAGISDAVRGGWDWGVELGVTPDAIFRPDFSAGGRIGRAIEAASGTVFYPNVSYRYDNYATGDIQTVQPGLTTYLENGVILTGRLIGTFQEIEDDQVGWLVQGRAPVSDKIQINAGYAQAPEAINGIAIDTKSLFGGVTYSIREDLDVHLNLARDDREDSYVRSSVNVGFTYKR